MASLKHPHPTTAPEEGPLPAKKTRLEPAPVSQMPRVSTRVELNPADCDLDFDIDGNGLQGHALHEEGFAYCWSGARANFGITQGKYCFGCKIVSEQVVDMADTPADQQHVCRVGISKGDDPVGNLGETLHSFGFGGTGKFSNAGKFSDYGTKFGVGDTIVCAVDLESKPSASIGFSKNGKWLGIARQFDATLRGLNVVNATKQNLPWASALFPHVLLKNVVVQLQFSIEDGLVPEEGYKPWNCALEDGNAIIGPSFTGPRECEVLMMVGLPASGKTTWAEKWVKEHPEKRYVLLGTNLALDQMKVPGLLRKQNYGERFERLMNRATGIFNTLLSRAAKTPRSYILDQTNVYKSARNRKLKAFVNYRKIAVVIFPTPNELKLRAEKRFKEMGKEVPADAVNEMLANFVLPAAKDMPGSNELFDEVTFPELGREEAQRHLNEMKRALGSPNVNAKREFSPYSRGSSVQSFCSPNVANKGAASVSCGPWATSQSTDLIPNHGSLITSQAHAAYPIPGSSGDHRKRFDHSSLPLPNDNLYGKYTNDGRASLHGAERDAYGRHGGSNPYDRNTYERSSIPSSDMRPYQTYNTTDAYGHDPYGRYGESNSYDRNTYERSSIASGDMRPYQTYNTTDAYGRPNFESPISSGKHGCPSAQASYSSPGAQLHSPGVPRVDHLVAREPPYEWRSPIQNTYGSPYAAPLHRPSYGGTPPNSVNPRPGSWYR